MVRLRYMALILGLALALVATACAAAAEEPQAQAPSVVALTPTTVVQPVVSSPDTDGASGGIQSSSDAGRAPDADGTAEGIQVHGQWTIEVRDPDGTVVDRREFENALTQQGAQLLAQLLGAARESGLLLRWAVQLEDGAGNPPCVSVPCGMFESDLVPIEDTDFEGSLDVSTLATGISLQGSFVADKAGRISNVATAVYSVVLPGIACGFGAGSCFVTLDTMADPFTATAISPLLVKQNQQVWVEVVISFS